MENVDPQPMDVVEPTKPTAPPAAQRQGRRQLFDANGDKNINFTEFVAGLSVFTVRAKAAEKARFSFRMYDFNADGKIDKAELGRMLQATIEENSLNITPEAAQELLDATFVEAECAEAGTMTFDEYTPYQY